MGGKKKKSDKHQDGKMSVCCIIFDNRYLLSLKSLCPFRYHHIIVILKSAHPSCFFFFLSLSVWSVVIHCSNPGLSLTVHYWVLNIKGMKTMWWQKSEKRSPANYRPPLSAPSRFALTHLSLERNAATLHCVSRAGFIQSATLGHLLSADLCAYKFWVQTVLAVDMQK